MRNWRHEDNCLRTGGGATARGVCPLLLSPLPLSFPLFLADGQTLDLFISAWVGSYEKKVYSSRKEMIEQRGG